MDKRPMASRFYLLVSLLCGLNAVYMVFDSEEEISRMTVAWMGVAVGYTIAAILERIAHKIDAP